LTKLFYVLSCKKRGSTRAPRIWRLTPRRITREKGERGREEEGPGAALSTPTTQFGNECVKEKERGRLARKRRVKLVPAALVKSRKKRKRGKRRREKRGKRQIIL